jgi:hypothetical protein
LTFDITLPRFWHLKRSLSALQNVKKIQKRFGKFFNLSNTKVNMILAHFVHLYCGLLYCGSIQDLLISAGVLIWSWTMRVKTDRFRFAKHSAIRRATASWGKPETTTTNTNLLLLVHLHIFVALKSFQRQDRHGGCEGYLFSKDILFVKWPSDLIWFFR